MNQTSPSDQHPIGKSILLHLLPGFLFGGGYFLLTPIFHRWGYPSIMPLMCVVLLIMIPVELGYLLYQGKKKNGRLSLRDIVMYRTPIPLGQYFLWIPVLFVILGMLFTLMKPVDTFLQQTLFGWMPLLESGLQTGYSRTALVITYTMVAIFGTVLGPLTEELYFRGFLLPRMGYAGKWAPLLHSLLFALYHIWTPWMFLTRTLGMLPLVVAVQKRNLYLVIIVHILINLVDVISAVIFILGLASLSR